MLRKFGLIFLPAFAILAVGFTLNVPKVNEDIFMERMDIEQRIIGGEEAAKNEFPWMVYITWQNSSGHNKFCGGAIIELDWVMTAGKCVLDALNGAENMTVIAGVNKRNDINETGRQLRDSNNITLHPSYYTLDGVPFNNIALIKIQPPFIQTVSVKPIQLPLDSMAYFESDAVVTGWGVTDPNNNSSIAANLQKTTVRISNFTACKEVYNNDGIVRVADEMLCTSAVNKSSCNEDAGGPLVCRLGNVPYVCGLVSWSFGCALPSYPDVYTRITSYNYWIRAVMDYTTEPTSTTGMSSTPIATTAEPTTTTTIAPISSTPQLTTTSDLDQTTEITSTPGSAQSLLISSSTIICGIIVWIMTSIKFISNI